MSINQKNTWAVVTGATDGIGMAYAKYFAEQGYNLLLISRNKEKLLNVKKQFTKQYGYERRVRILAIDFKYSDQSIYNKIESEFQNIDKINVLVNNVGICYPNERPEYLTQIPNLNQFIMDLINVNIIACTRLTAMVLPRMEVNEFGIIINISSITALFPAPLLSLYSASKAYIVYMSRGLQEEYRHKGIIIQTLIPSYVSTKMSHNKSLGFYVPSVDQFVKHAMRTIGKEDLTTGYFSHKYQHMFAIILNFMSQLSGINLDQKVYFFKSNRIRNRINTKYHAS